MFTWDNFRRLCIYGFAASILVGFGFWNVKRNHVQYSQTYYRESAMPALARAKDALASWKNEIPDITPILNQHIENQAKIAEADWNLFLCIMSAKIFILGLSVCRVREEYLKRREKRKSAEQKNENEPNQSLQPTTMLVTDAAAQPPRQARSRLI